VSTTQNYGLEIVKGGKRCWLSITAHDNNHAQAQAKDIRRALKADKYLLTYSSKKHSKLSDLFERLAFNKFTHDCCDEWDHSLCNGVPCTYILGQRFYIRKIILSYLDIPEDNVIKPSCDNKNCINPYHFKYLPEKNSKMTSGDLKLLLAYRSQGTGVAQTALALNVHRSTIYRNLKR
jgi:hypothetical protein